MKESYMTSMVIYKIVNLINGKIYVGQNNGKRKNYFGSGKLLKQAILKHGKNNFKKEILQTCDSVEDLDKYEIYWIKELNATDRKIGYNICEGGRVNRNMKGENHPMYGKTYSPEMRKKISEATKKGMTAEVRQKIKDKRKLQVFSEETRKLWSEHRKGKNNPMYGKKGILHPNYGRICSDDTKRRIGIANSGKNNGMYEMSGEKNPCATKYIIRTPENEIIEIISKNEVMKQLKCSGFFFQTKKFKKYILLDSIKINKG